MFSLDVVNWRKSRSEKEAARIKHAEKNAAPLSKAEQDRQAKRLYGKTMKEMHTSYIDRVSNWTKEAPAQEWGRNYGKEDYEKSYVPRVRQKEREHGGAVKNGCYSPQVVYKGGGKFLHRLESLDKEEMPRDKYAKRIVNFEKTREKHKEIHPPMAFLKSKPLSCAKYFVEDVICTDNNSPSERDRLDASQGAKRGSCSALCPSSPERVTQSDEEDENATEEEIEERRQRRHNAVYDRLYWNAHGSRATVLGGATTPLPPTTAEYVAHPKWRQHSPEKWVGGRPFTSTISSSNIHTASRSSITGVPYSRALLIDDPFAPAGATNSPTTPQVRAFEHERRVEMAAAAAHRPVQKPDRKYFNSIWTEPPDRSLSPLQHGNPGREFIKNLHEQHNKV